METSPCDPVSTPTAVPLLTVTGAATPEEVAALLAVVAARRAALAAARTGPATYAGPASTWTDPRHALRGPRPPRDPGPHGWRTSSWPR
jgi:hypothetical protein